MGSDGSGGVSRGGAQVNFTIKRGTCNLFVPFRFPPQYREQPARSLHATQSLAAKEETTVRRNNAHMYSLLIISDTGGIKVLCYIYILAQYSGKQVSLYNFSRDKLFSHYFTLQAIQNIIDMRLLRTNNVVIEKSIDQSITKENLHLY